VNDILAAIDATLDGRCACGCGIPLDPHGPSGWYLNEDHQVAAAQGHTAAVWQLPAVPDGVATSEFAARVNEAAQQLTDVAPPQSIAAGMRVTAEQYAGQMAAMKATLVSPSLRVQVIRDVEPRPISWWRRLLAWVLQPIRRCWP
jgi:hypothetical protein